MSFELVEIGPCKKRAQFDLTSKDVQESFDEVYNEICETISFPGFRKGKVPRSLIAKKHGKDIVGEVKEKLISKTFYAMIDEEKIDIISQPAFDEKEKEFQEGQGFTYSVSFEIKPDFDLPDYKGITLQKEEKEVTDENINETQDNLLKSHAKLEEVEEAIAEEDYPTLSLNVEDETGEVIHHNHSFMCFLSAKRLDIFEIENLVAELKGLKKGDEKEITYEVPTEFPANEELAGKKVTLKVSVDDVKRAVVPEFNDEFLKQLGFETEEEYRNTLKEMLEKEFEKNAREDLKNQIYDYLNEKVVTDLPEDTITQHSDYLINTKVMELMRSGVPQAEAEAKKDELKSDAVDSAKKEIKVGFTLSKIAEAEKVLVTEREISNRIVQLAAQRQMAPEKLKEELEKNHEVSALRSQIKEEKTIDYLIKKAKFEEKKAEEKKAAPKKKAAAKKTETKAKKETTKKKAKKEE
jgi:trigger factor